MTNEIQKQKEIMNKAYEVLMKAQDEIWRLEEAEQEKNEKLFKKSMSYYEIGHDLTKTLGLDKDSRLEVININSLKRNDRTLVVEKFFEEAKDIDNFFYGLDKPISRKEFIEKATKKFLESIEE